MDPNITRQMRAQCPCASIDYCPLEPFVHSSERMLIQCKCMEVFKYKRSETAGKDLGRPKASALWVEEGFAKRFSEIYHDGISVEEVLKLLEI